jgi:hypothetical protein
MSSFRDVDHVTRKLQRDIEPRAAAGGRGQKIRRIWGIENVYPTSDGEGGIYAVNGGRMLTIVKAHLQ